jgi:outer membrane protein assembly factor BamB
MTERQDFCAAMLIMLAACGSLWAEAPLGRQDFMPSPERPVGFRGDWTGRYPGATPPLHWSATSNVIWKTEVGVGEASPVVVGDKLFILTDGNRVTCLNRSDGGIVWRCDRHLRGDVPEEAAVLLVEEYVVRYHRLRPVAGRLSELQSQAIRLRQEGDRSQVSPSKLLALEEELDACRRAYAPLEASVREVAHASNTVSRSGQPNRYMGQSPVTQAIATPCSDGRRLYAWLPMGVIVACDLDGRREWVRVLGDQRYGGGWWGAHVAPSPLLVDGKLVIHYDQIYCLDAETGRTVWVQRQRLLSIPSPVPGRRNGSWYVGLGTMQILRLSDGEYVYGDDVGGHHDCVGVGSPISFDGVFCWTSHAVEAPDTPGGHGKLLWELDGDAAGRMTQFNHVARPKEGKPFVLRGMGWHGYGSPVEQDGVIYYQHEGRIFSALGAKTGKLLYAEVSTMVDPKDRTCSVGGGVYPSLTAAGDYVFASGDRGTLVISPGREKVFRPIAFNGMGPSGGNMLVFAGCDMFIHAGSYLYCVRECAPLSRCSTKNVSPMN